MTKQSLVGVGLLLTAVLLTLYNVSDVIADLKNWHDASTPQFVGAILKQIATVGLSAIGGTLLPQPGSVAAAGIDPKRFTDKGPTS